MPRETILIVDDEEDIVELIKYNLKTEGYVILTAGTGEQAIKSARKSRPDLIVLDLMLPGIDGLEVTRYLKTMTRPRISPSSWLRPKGKSPMWLQVWNSGPMIIFPNRSAPGNWWPGSVPFCGAAEKR